MGSDDYPANCTFCGEDESRCTYCGKCEICDVEFHVDDCEALAILLANAEKLEALFAMFDVPA